MKASNWDTLSAWFNAWLAADDVERDRLRARLALEQPDLLDEADELAAAGGHLPGFLETPAVVLEARNLAQEDPLLAVDSMVGPYRVVSLIARGGMGDVTAPPMCGCAGMWRSRYWRRRKRETHSGLIGSCRKHG
jgi:hypothetical protein